MLINAISALRSIVELLGLCLLGQATLYIFVGSRSGENVIYRFFSLLTVGPRKITSRLLWKNAPTLLSDFVCFMILLTLWIFLAFIRRTIALMPL
jgi:hypothetical protein